MTLDRDLVRQAGELLARAAIVAEAPGQRLDAGLARTVAAAHAPRSQGESAFDQVARLLRAGAAQDDDDELRTAINHASRALRRVTHRTRSFDLIAWESIHERRRIARELAPTHTQGAIARRLGVDQATVSRDLRSDAA